MGHIQISWSINRQNQCHSLDKGSSAITLCRGLELPQLVMVVFVWCLPTVLSRLAANEEPSEATCPVCHGLSSGCKTRPLSNPTAELQYLSQISTPH